MQEKEDYLIHRATLMVASIRSAFRSTIISTSFHSMSLLFIMLKLHALYHRILSLFYRIHVMSIVSSSCKANKQLREGRTKFASVLKFLSHLHPPEDESWYLLEAIDPSPLSRLPHLVLGCEKETRFGKYGR